MDQVISAESKVYVETTTISCSVISNEMRDGVVLQIPSDLVSVGTCSDHG